MILICQILTERLPQINQNTCLLKMNLKKLKTFYSSYFIGESDFEGDGTKNYLVFQPTYKYFKIIAGVGNCKYIYYWKYKGLPDKKINYIKTPNHNITPNVDYYGTKTRVKLNGNYLKQDKVTFNHGKVVNIYIVYEIRKRLNIRFYPTLENCLFRAVSLTKNADIDQYKYSGYEMGFDRHKSFSFSGTG